MSKYTTCLECGSVDVDKDSTQEKTRYVCNECGHSETAVNGSHIERGLVYFDGFETLQAQEVKELRG